MLAKSSSLEYTVLYALSEIPEDGADLICLKAWSSSLKILYLELA